MSEDNNENGFTLDDEVKEELENVVSEDQLIGSYSSDGNGSEKVPVLQSWLPEGDDWQGKTVVNAKEARVLAMARNITTAFDEVEHMEPFINNLLTDLEQYLTSVDGLSREQQKQVLTAMFGKTPEKQEAQSMMLGALAGKDNDD